jgi:hypothetical protein
VHNKFGQLFHAPHFPEKKEYWKQMGDLRFQAQTISNGFSPIFKKIIH